MTHAGGGGEPERPRAGLRVGHPHRRVERRRPLVDLVEERAQVTGEVVERAARRHHVDEAEQRRAQLGVARGELHRLVVQRLDRVAGGGRERIGELATDALDFALRATAVMVGRYAGPGLLD